MSKEEIAIKLKAAREKKNLKQEDVAAYLGVTPQKVSSFETGRTRVDIDTLAKLCELYDVDMNHIVGIEKSPSFYNDAAADAYMNLIHENPGLRLLLDASAKLTKEDIEAVVEIVKRMKATEQD